MKPVLHASLLLLLSQSLATPAAPPNGAVPWWKAMAGNSQSPLVAIFLRAGAQAVDCGQFGPDATEQQITDAIACGALLASQHRAFFTMRHFWGPDETLDPHLPPVHRWLAEGLYGRDDGSVMRFDYRGRLQATGLQPEVATFSEQPCSEPRARLDGSVAHFVCAPARGRGEYR